MTQANGTADASALIPLAVAAAEAEASPLMSVVSPETEAPWRAGLRSARANIVPGLVLQAGALALVLAYYRHPPTRALLTDLAEFRQRSGVIFAIISTGLFGGLIPLLYLRSQRLTRNRYTFRQGAWLVAFWAYKGLEIDLFYRLLAHTFGEGHDAVTIASKMITDQLIYCPIFAVPLTVLAYDWGETHFTTHRVAADVRAGNWYRRRVLPLLLSNFGVWIPTVCIIYALPTPLQLPLQNLVLCFFTLMIAHQTARAR